MALSDPRLSELSSVARSSRGESAEDVVAPIDRLPKWLLCVPLALQVMWLGMKYRSITLPSVLNPGIENGGLVGESKFSYLALIGSEFRSLVADTALASPSDDLEKIRKATGLSFPLIAKPDIGWCGYGVRRIENAQLLAAYAAAYPKSARFLLQRLAVEPNEAGIHYVRRPSETRGRIVALTIRHQPHVIGDGEATVAALIAGSPATARKAELYHRLLGDVFLARVPRPGERVELTTVASVRVGGRYEDATAMVSPKLADAIDGLCRSMGEFHYGRLDVRFASVEQLRRGRFTIIEINGAGSEAIQYWDPRLSMRQAFAGVFAKQRELYELADEVRRGGRQPPGWRAIAKAHLNQQKLIREYPPSN